jgi:hypothetical protein
VLQLASENATELVAYNQNTFQYFAIDAYAQDIA